jgi:hypothetical protein
VWTYDDRRSFRGDVAFLILFSCLLAYHLLRWQRLVGSGPEWHPLQSIALSASLFLVSLATVARRRSRWIARALLVMSAAALAVTITARY